MRPIRTLALIDEPYVNTLETLYYEAKKDKNIDFNFVLILPKDKRFPDNTYKHLSKMMREYNLPYIDGYNESTGEELDIKTMKPDIVFLQTPYDGVKRSILYSSEYLETFTRIIHISYGATLVDYDFPPYRSFNMIGGNSFFSKCWFCAMENFLIAKQFNKYHPGKFKAFGYIKLDKFINYTKNEFPRKERSNYDHIIVWKPRWLANSGDSTFLDYIDFFKQFVEQNPKILFLFSAHPLLKDRLISEKIYTKKQTEEIFDFFNNKPNAKIIGEKDFLEDIYNADIFIGDYSSTIVEAAILGCQIIYTPVEVKLSKFGKHFVKKTHVANNVEELISCIDICLKNNRNKGINKYFLKICSIKSKKGSYAKDLLAYIKKYALPVGDNTDIKYLGSNTQLKEPKISVIMPCYNSEKFVQKSIESVINQTYRNWELLCVNDRSADNTLQILNQYAKKDTRIKVFDKKERAGRAAPNCNYVLEKITGDFIYRLDPDDSLSSDCMEKAVKRQQETQADIVIPDTCFVYPNNSTKNWTMAGISSKWGKTNKKINRDIILTGRQAFELSLNWRIHALSLVKAEIVKKYKYCEKGMNGDEYSARAFFLNANKVAFSQGTYFYYQLDSSITKKMTPKLWDVYWTQYFLEQLLIENNFDYDLVKNMRYTRLLLYKRLLNLYEKNRKNFTQEEQAKIENYLSENRKLLTSSKIDINRSYWLDILCKIFIKIKIKLKRPKYE